METKWHALSVSEVLKILETGEHGLNLNEAERRLKKYGINKLPESKVDGVALIFLRQFQSPLIYILVVASIAVFIMGENVDGLIILFVLVFNAIIGAIQEGKARDTLLALKKFVETKAIIIREEKELILP